MNREVTRKELYDLVWSKSLTQLSKDFGLSLSQIKKVCGDNNIPLPENGYWSKIKFGKDVKKVSLDESIGLDTKIELSVDIEISPKQKIIDEIVADTKAPVKVPEKLRNPDKLVSDTEAYYNKSKKDRYFRDDSSTILYINVTDKNEKRALRFMDALIKLLRYRNFSFTKEYRQLKMIKDDVRFPFYLREHHKRVPNKEGSYPSFIYEPTGNFIFTVGEHSIKKEWSDSKIKLEDRLIQIVADIEILVQKEKEWQERIRISHEKYERERKIKEEQEALRKQEEAKFNQLLTEAKRFEESNLIRKYIQEIERKAITENNLTDELKEWIKWANDKADSIDPLSTSITNS